MSLSNPKAVNPAQKFIEFKGDKGVFQYYQKSENPEETGENIEIKLPVYFMVLDELSCVRGFNDETNSGVYSNEVHSVAKEMVTVKTGKGGKSVKGYYKDIKGDIASMGGKFCKSIYALLITSDGNEIVNFQLTGAALSAWMDIRFNKEQFVVAIESCSDEKKGKVNYKKPVFIPKKVRREIMQEAIQADQLLQKYLDSYKNTQIEEEEKKELVNEPEYTNDNLDVDVDQLPF